MKKNIDISVITINYNGYNDTCNFIDSWHTNITTITYEIIIIDNGSYNDESINIKKKYPYVITLRNKINLGFAAANNQAIKIAKGKYLFFLNNDIIIIKKNIESLIYTLKSSIDIAGISPLILNMDSKRSIQFAGFTKLTKISQRNHIIGENSNNKKLYPKNETPYLHGAAMLIKKEAIENVGLMDEDYFLYYEELDWSEKFTNKGYKLLYDPSYELIHLNSKTVGRNSPFKIFYLTRNRLLFSYKNRKGFNLLLIMLYQVCCSTPKNIFLSILHNRIDIAKAYFKGTLYFFYFSLKHKKRL